MREVFAPFDSALKSISLTDLGLDVAQLEAKCEECTLFS